MPITLEFVLVEFILVETVLVGDPLYRIADQDSVGYYCARDLYEMTLVIGRASAVPPSDHIFETGFSSQ
jgi:hypothetical protein